MVFIFSLISTPISFYYRSINIQFQFGSMISYKIISQEHYENLAKLSADFPSQRSLLIQANTQFIFKLNQIRDQTAALQYQLQTYKHQIDQLSSQNTHLSTQLQLMSQNLKAEIDNSKKMAQEINETSNLLKKALEEKNVVLNQNQTLMQRIKTLEMAILELNTINEKAQEKQKLLQSRIASIELSLKHQNQQKLTLQCQIGQKNQIIQDLNAKLNQKSELLENIVSEYETCKQEKLGLENQMKKFQESPIPKLQEKIQANQIWISELTQTINQLRQKCIQLEMGRPLPGYFKQSLLQPLRYASKTPYPVRQAPLYSPRNMASYTPKLPLNQQKTQGPSAPEHKIPQAGQNIDQTFLVNRQRLQESQRMKYLTICKQLVQQFNSKLSKIQQQKKSMEEKYQSLKLKLNEYQYNEFKYKDRISLYLQKIQRYEKLTEKQQSQMQNIILQFEQELTNVVRMKEQEVRGKLEEQISKYQVELQRLREEEEMTKKLQQQAYEQLIKQGGNVDDFDFEMLKRAVQRSEDELAQKSSELARLKKQLQRKQKQLQKYKSSKQSYKQKAVQLQEQCYQNSIQIRRLKGLVQQLCQQLQTKSNQNQILRHNLKYNQNNRTNRSDEDSRLKYNDPVEFNQHSSAKVCINNNFTAAKRSGSEKFQYQFSQIDSELQRRNEVLINHILLRKLPQHNQDQTNSPAVPSKRSQLSDQIPKNDQYWTRISKKSLKDSLDSNDQSQLSSSSQNQSQKHKNFNSGNANPNNSTSSKNSYQSYGIRNLYKEKPGLTQTFGQRYLMHKNSLQ